MAYITKTYYDELFGETDLSEDDFNILADISSDLIDSLCCPSPSGDDIVKDKFQKAVAYQVRFLHEQGGISTVFAQSAATLSGGSESLGDYSVSSGSGTDGSKTVMLNGIPVCGYTILLLEQLGLMVRLVRRAWRAENS